MRIGVLGTGMVGSAIATKLVALGHDVMMGSRTRENEKAAEWVASAGAGASAGTFADAAAHGELVFNCTGGGVSIEAIGTARSEDLAGKILVDVANPLDFSQGMPPSLRLRNRQSRRAAARLSECAHREDAEHGQLRGHGRPVAGPWRARHLRLRERRSREKGGGCAARESFGWPDERIVDLGDISAARGTEAYLLFWLRLYGATGTSDFNIRVTS